MPIKPTIITIAAVSGGGKTSVTNQLNQELSNCTALYFDDYDFKESPKDIIEWVNNGADYNEWDLAPLIQDINSVLSKEEQIDFIIVDYPFAYLNDGMKELIDLTIYIDTPLDIAMARRIVRDYSEKPNAIRNDLINYLTNGRTGYIEMIRSVKPNSNIIIDGKLTVREITNKIIEEIRTRIL
ncbi:hypothetical protein [Paenibacillus sp. HB172176]|uniref:hypothetical protein n=1 Tax=Paenibacillus sp. HB172176 TaxID=2493690 RepID=UPI00143B22C8|nr:hypothetical protein [Paenibacillus sp. HB172176]